MSDTKPFDEIRLILDSIRKDELRPGYKVHLETTLRTCPGDINRISWQLNEIQNQLTAAQGALVVPDGWQLALLRWNTDDHEYEVEMYKWGEGDHDSTLAEGYGPTWHEALAAAIASANGSTSNG